MALLATTRTTAQRDFAWPGESPLHLMPTSLYCYKVGQRVLLDPHAGASQVVPEPPETG